MADQRLEHPDDGERGSAVVDFVMVSLLIVALLLAVLQVGVYVHVRNVVTASAQAGARYAANADVDSSYGAARTVEIVARATTVRTAEGLRCTSGEQVGGTCPTLVVVRCLRAGGAAGPSTAGAWSPAGSPEPVVLCPARRRVVHRRAGPGATD